MSRLDLLILTAANAAQARGYEIQLAHRRRLGAIAGDLHTRVVPDSGGRRIGSGASTFLALRAAAKACPLSGGRETLASRFEGRNILIIHSGGDSRRLPAYAALGKVFVPLPFRRGEATGCLLDLILDDLSGMFDDPAGRVVIAAGDLVVGLGGRAVRRDAEVVGVAVQRPIRVGARHGVFVTDGAGRWLDFLQKPRPSEMRERGALDGRTVLVDSGIVSLSPSAAGRWLQAAGASLSNGRLRTAGLLRQIEMGRAPAVDLYVHLLAAFAERLDEARYLDACADGGGAGAAARDLFAELRSALHPLSARVAVMPGASFLHLGTTHELFEALTNRTVAQRFGFFSVQDMLRGSGHDRFSAARWDRPPDVVLEACGSGVGVLSGPRPKGENVIVGLSARPSRSGRLARWTLPRGWCATSLPVGARQWTMLLHHLDDDFKRSIDEGGTLGGVELRRWRHLLAMVKHDPAMSLFDLAIWPVGTMEQVELAARWLARGSAARPPAAWRAARCLSLREIVLRVDQRRMIEFREACVREHGRSMLGAALLMAGPRHAPRLADALALAVTKSEASELADELLRFMKNGDLPPQACRAARAVQVADALVRRFPQVARGRSGLVSADPRARAMACVGRAVQAAMSDASASARDAGDSQRRRTDASGGAGRGMLRPGRVVRVRTPVRIDLAGGWTDTSPISEEQGGCVVNAAVTLDREAPVEVVARAIDRPSIILHSVDAGERAAFEHAEELSRHGDPRDWSALGKAALVLSGYVPARASQTLSRHLHGLGGGVEVTMRSGVPRGSGLGTSSILAATLLAALEALRGRRLAQAEMVKRTSVVEQMISTRGGWQDQIGGVVPGIKLSRTIAPAGRGGDGGGHGGSDGDSSDDDGGGGGGAGLPRVRRLAMPPSAVAELESRSLLIFTGIRRMARGILENVIWRYLAGEPEVIEAIPQLRRGAESMADAVERGDIDAIARWFDDYWRLKKVMDPGSTTPAIEALIRPYEPRLSAWGLTGAGGGGFALLIAKSSLHARALRSEIAARPKRGVRLFSLSLDTKGMRVAVEE